ncbi:MAG TPA: winged helix-turn-helix domain-containing protein [Solirubrobacterales bacterium]|nr:winged helix-turn-helix domain-containing protein [Solirubrobacterales bacterium]
MYAHPIRLRIVTELYMKGMSPTQYFEEFGGASKNLIHWHFRQLASHGWLKKVKTEKRKSGRGRPQDVYRATELAVIGDDTWRELPLSIRSAFSHRTLEQMREQVKAAFASDTLDSRPDRHLTWTPAFLETEALAQQLQAMTACFWAVLEEQAGARARLELSGEDPVLMTVVLAGFESPPVGAENGARPGSAPAPLGSSDQLASEVPWMMRLAKVFVDPLNLRIITALNLETMSPSQLAARFESPSVFSIDRRCKLLTELGWIFKVGEKTGGERRGATENFYRATGPAVFDGDEWYGLSSTARKGASATTFRQFWERVTEALSAGTFDARIDRHLTWCSLLVDQQGWDRVIALLDNYFADLLTVCRKKKVSPRSSNGSMGTFLLAGFEGPQIPSAEDPAVF